MAKKVFLTRASYRGADCNLLKRETIGYANQEKIEVVEDVKKAVRKAVKEAKDEMVIVTGSLFVVGEARSLWHKVKP